MFPDLTRDDVFRLETRRLWLRWPNAADAAAIARLAGEAAVAEMTGSDLRPHPPTLATEFILRSRAANMEGRSLVMAVAPRAKPRELIGMVSICPARDGAVPELGYWIGRPYWDQGFATEAARALVDAFFAYTDGRELTASSRVTNPAARRVLERCGFSAVGSAEQTIPARGGVSSVQRVALDRQRWHGLRRAGRPGGTAAWATDNAAAATM